MVGSGIYPIMDLEFKRMMSDEIQTCLGCWEYGNDCQVVSGLMHGLVLEWSHLVLDMLWSTLASRYIPELDRVHADSDRDRIHSKLMNAIVWSGPIQYY